MWRYASLLAGSLLLIPGACTSDYTFDSDLEDFVCDDRGCWHCDGGHCEEYRCDQTHQCPHDRVCTADGRCLEGDPGPSDPEPEGCTAHEDCAKGEICTLDGECVPSPGGEVPDGNDSPDLPDHPDDVCTHSGDCGADGTCLNGGCYFPCRADDSCPPGQACDAGQCVPDDDPENLCTFNGECGSAHVCLEGTCYETCEETLDCGEHTKCVNDICVADLSPVIQCSGPGSCPEGEGCVDGKCLSACDADNGNGCGDAQECRFGFCHQIVTCFDRADCGGSDCVDGACAP